MNDEQYIDELAKYSKNKIEIVKELHRDKAVEVLKKEEVINMNLDFKEKVYLITGSTSGIGQRLAKALLEDGAKIVINYAHNEENAEETKRLFSNYSDKTLYIKADVSNEEEVKNMYEQINRKYGGILLK